MRATFAVIVLLAAALATSVAAQPLSGVYTCANGNPGSAFDYGDIGDFFNDLEDLGVNGPVTLLVYDDGGPFSSTSDYLLGGDPTTTAPFVIERPISGVSAVNTITVQAAAGERPVLFGAGARTRALTSSQLGCISIHNTRHTTISGLSISQCGAFGVFVYSSQTGGSDHFRVSRCVIATGGVAICVSATNGSAVNFVLIENNTCVNVGAAEGLYWATSVLGERSGLEWIVRNNTVVKRPISADFAGYAFECVSQIPWQEFTGNVVRIHGEENSCVFRGGPYPLLVDYNVVWLTGGARMANYVVETWALWQALGFDANGVNADPRFVSVVPGLEDLRLRADSPARDLVPFGPLTDVFGNPRPVGARFDAGAHEFEHAPTLEVVHQGADIPHGGALNAGNFNVLGDLRGFTLRNIGPVDLTLTGNPLVEIIPFNNIGPGTAVQSQPSLSLIPPAASVNFTIFIQPAAVGPFHLRVSISNSDPHYSPYYFEIIGDVPFNQPAEAAPGAMLTGPPGGPFAATLDPGATAGLTVHLSDPEADPIDILSITPLGTPALGITPPGIPAPGHPLALSWTGVVDPANPPGLYQWQLEFADIVNQTPQVVIIELTIRDLPPGHAPVAPGAGTQGNPYTATFAVGDDSSASASLADVADPNSAQTLAVTGFSPNAAFTFALVGGQLTASPRAVLIPAELGAHNFALSISDGTNAITVYAALTVQAAGTLSITTPSPLPVGALNAAYSVTLQAAGATGAIVWALQGALPTGLYLDVGTGTIAGTPSEAGPFSFIITARDAVTQTAAPFDLQIAAPPPPPRDTAGGSSGGGCVAGVGAWPWIFALFAFRRRRGVFGARPGVGLAGATGRW